ncbi:hypothetical protein V1477_008064, partial [Vespula maculifrons]
MEVKLKKFVRCPFIFNLACLIRGVSNKTNCKHSQYFLKDRKSFQWNICKSFCVLFRILGSVHHGKLSKTQYFYIIITFSSESTTISTNFIFIVLPHVESFLLRVNSTWQLFFRKFKKIGAFMTSLDLICLGGLGLVYRVNFCWVADSFAISVVPTRNASFWSFEVLHSPPQGFSAYTCVPNSIECLISEDVRLKDREIFHYSINIFGNSKSDIADEKSSIVCIEDTSNPQVLLSRTPVIFLIIRSLAITNLKPQSICLALKSLAIIVW